MYYFILSLYKIQMKLLFLHSFSHLSFCMSDFGVLNETIKSKKQL